MKKTRAGRAVFCYAGKMWKLIQLAIVVAVIFSNIHYDWAHGTSPLAVAVVAIFAAWFVTALWFTAADLSLKLKALLLRRKQSVGNGGLPRR
jgi:hypothetical protein